MTEKSEGMTSSLEPYKELSVQVVVEKYSPQFIERLRNVEMPKNSPNPDELEAWESGVIDSRKERFPHEGDFSYLLRVLYEETFSVNQFQDSLKTSNGLTVGGLISHFYMFGSINGVSVEDVKNWNLDGKSLREVLQNTNDFRKREDIFEIAESITFPLQIGRVGASHLMRMQGQLRSNLLKNPKEGHYREDLDTYGFRLMKLIKQIPELTDEIKDEKLKEMVHFPSDRKLTGAHFLVRVWKRLSGLVLDENGYYKREGEEEAIQGLKDLITLRTHPELQFLYKFKSPSGYINNNQD